MKKLKQVLCVWLTITVFVVVCIPPVFASATNSVNLANCCFTISSALSNSKCLDVSNAGIDNGTNIQIWSTNATFAQIFYISKFDSEWYSIKNIGSNKVLDVAGGKTGSGVNVQLYSWNQTAAQLWKFYDAGNGYYYIKNKLGYYLDVSGGRSDNGTNVQVYQFNGTNSQKWKLTPSDGIYSFTSALNNSKCLDVSNAGTENHTNIQLWTSNNTLAQKFYITKVDSEWFSIRNVSSQKALDVTGGVRKSGVNVQLYDWNKSDAQLWKFYSAGNGYYYIQNKLGYYLDVTGGNTADGTNVQVYQCNRTKSQMWKIELVDLTQELFSNILVNFQLDLFFSDIHPLEKLASYYQKFNHGAKYDIKVKDCWNNLFSNVAYPGFSGVILFNGIAITPEQFGNIIYGLAGNILGFSDMTIYQGGGYAASGSKYLNDASKYYGDSAMDHEFISMGIKISNKPTDAAGYIDLSDVPDWILDLARYML